MPWSEPPRNRNGPEPGLYCSDLPMPDGGVLMYLGPDTAMPLASAIAAVVGVAVMFWHKTRAFLKGVGRSVGRLFTRRR